MTIPHLLDFFVFIRVGSYDEESVQEVDGNAMGRSVGSATNFGDATIGGDDQNGSHVIFQSAIQEGERLDVQHVNLHRVEKKWELIPRCWIMDMTSSYYGPMQAP